MPVGLNPLSYLPQEVNFQIFSYFNPFELGRCHLVSREWHVLASTDALWKNLTPAIAFGKREWETYFGEVGEEPPLPRNIYQILHSPCPFWKGKRIGETHLLVLIPRSVNHQSMTLKHLAELVKAPKKECCTIQYRYFWDDAMEIYGGQPIKESYWILITKDILPGSHYESLEDHQIRIQKYPSYKLPRAIEASVALFSEYVASKTRLYSDDPWTYTRCEEEIGDCSVVVGGFTVGGPIVCNDWKSKLGIGVCQKL